MQASDLGQEGLRHLRPLSKANADQVARHLAYAGSVIDDNPELAYEHAKAAYASARRIDIVREALGVTSYLTGRYGEALRELRTYRRMTDDNSHVTLEADAERGLGRPEKALSFIAEIPMKRLDPATQIELAIVTSGARADAGDSEGGLAAIEKVNTSELDGELRARVELVRADRLEEVGRDTEADEIRGRWQSVFDGDAVDIETEEPSEDSDPQDAKSEQDTVDNSEPASAAGADVTHADAAGGNEAATEEADVADAESSATATVESTDQDEADRVASADDGASAQGNADSEATVAPADENSDAAEGTEAE